MKFFKNWKICYWNLKFYPRKYQLTNGNQHWIRSLLRRYMLLYIQHVLLYIVYMLLHCTPGEVKKGFQWNSKVKLFIKGTSLSWVEPSSAHIEASSCTKLKKKMMFELSRILLFHCEVSHYVTLYSAFWLYLYT